MTDDQHTCHAGGRVVHGRLPVPDAPFDYIWPSFRLVYGCNRLICAGTGEPVRQRPGFSVPRDLRPADVARVYRADDWEPLVVEGLLSKQPYARTYVSPTHVHVEASTRWIESPRDDELNAPFPRWRCGGHPRFELPTTLDGERLDAETDWVALALGVFQGRRPDELPGFLRSERGAWVERLYHLLVPSPEAAELARAIAGLLEREDPAVRGGALEFIRTVPEASGADRLDALIPASAQTEWLHAPNPAAPHETLGEVAAVTLAGRLASLEDCDESPTIEAARRAVLWGNKRQHALIEGLGRCDPDWLAANAEAVLRAAPTGHTFASLLRALRLPFGDAVIGIAERLARTELVARADIQASLPGALSPALRSQVLERLARGVALGD